MPTNTGIAWSIAMRAGEQTFAGPGQLYPLGLDMAIPQLQIQLSSPVAGGDDVLLFMTVDAVATMSLGAEGDGRLNVELTDFLALNNIVVNGGILASALPSEFLVFAINNAVPGLVANLEPVINDLLNAPRLELDMGEMLGDWLDSEFPSVPVEAYITETGVDEVETYLSVGAGIDFHQGIS